MSDVLVCSFYTPGGYYEECAEKLASDVEALGLELHLKRMVVPEGKSWPEICRIKVPFIQEVRHAHPGRLLLWVDVDCRLQDLPGFVRNTTADLIGFQRGFGSPLSIGYATTTRFWEPCFLGFGPSDAATEFIDRAAAAERTATFDATDDYFFEEAWRALAPKLTYQLIPSELSKHTNPQRFFVFGSSANVRKYKGKVQQHSAPAEVVRRNNGVMATLRKLALRHLPDPAIDAIVTVRHWLKAIQARQAITRLEQSKNASPEDDRPLQLRALGAFVKQNMALADVPDNVRIDRLASALGKQDPEVAQILDWGQAFRAYRNGPTTAPVTELMWWDTPAPGNFGDWLSPYIFGRVGETRIKYADPRSRAPKPHILGLGSIVKFARHNTTVMGSGIAARNTAVDPAANYVFVRGRHTADCIVKCGGVAPDVFGDPGIVMSRLYSPDIVREPGSVALVRHIRHRPLSMQLPSYMEEISIWAAQPQAIESFIARIKAKDYVVTSAMHCFIVCQSYGIPCALVTFEGLEDVVPGDGVKYLDYLSGVGLPEAAPDLLPTDLRTVDLHNWVRPDRVSKAQIDGLYDLIKARMPAVQGSGEPIHQ